MRLFYIYYNTNKIKSKKRNKASNKSGVRQGPLYKVSFKLGLIVFELASNTTQSFVELWSSLMPTWCGKY